MKKVNWKWSTLLVSSVLVLASCGDDNEPAGGTNGGDDNGNTPEVTELKGILTQNLTLKEGKTYSLTGGYHVKQGVTLTIEPGVTIVAKDDDIVDYILIEQGAKIDAQGTVAKPIVMTSESKEAGAWGGLHICGKAPINVTGATSKSEIGDVIYGGSDAADNSGILRYIRLEYAGYSFSEEKEANGFTFYGVGNGTVAEYLQAYRGSDDGFEWFGGTMDVRHLVSTDNSDDSFDWTEGWCGKGQFLVAYQSLESEIGYESDCLIEADNNSKNFASTPIANPVLANLTLIGNGSTTNKRGIRLRAGTFVHLYNTLVKGKPSCLTTETIETENSLVDGTSILDYIHIESGIASAEGIYSEALFTANENNAVNQALTFSSKYKGVVAGGKDMTVVDAFFTKAIYKGAVDPNNDWTAGWTK